MRCALQAYLAEDSETRNSLMTFEKEEAYLLVKKEKIQKLIADLQVTTGHDLMFAVDTLLDELRWLKQLHDQGVYIKKRLSAFHDREQPILYQIHSIENEAQKKRFDIEKPAAGETEEAWLQRRIKVLECEANEGNLFSRVLLGDCYKEGKGGEQSFEKAFYHYKLAADQNDSCGQLRLASCYENGKGVQQSLDMADYYFKLVAERGKICGQYAYAKFLERHHRYADAFFFFKVIAESVTNYFTKASKWHSSSQVSLAIMYEEGRGVAKSQTAALTYYQLAAKAGNAHALRRLGDAYSGLASLEGITVSLEQAEYHYSSAAKGGDLLAQYRLACVLYKEKRFEDAFCYFKMTADNGDYDCDEIQADAQYILASMFEKGEGIEASPTDAFFYYQMAADRGHATAQYCLGQLYLEGKGIEQSIEKARHYFELAALHDHSEVKKVSQNWVDMRLKFIYKSITQTMITFDENKPKQRVRRFKQLISKKSKRRRRV